MKKRKSAAGSPIEGFGGTIEELLDTRPEPFNLYAT